MNKPNKFFDIPHLAGIAFLLHFTLWFLISRLVNIAPDMADHWVWSREMYLSYYEHPPMIAWAMKIITLIGGNNETALEIGSILYNCLILFLAYIVAKVYFNRKTAILYLLILMGTPYFSAGSLFLHIDQPYMIFWLVGLLVWRKYLQSHNTNWILLLGVVAGLGALSKYITILFYIGIFVWCLIRKDQRHLLLQVKLYLAGIISLAIFSPVILWNYQNNWASFRYQFTRGLTGASVGENFLLFTSGHLVLFSLVFALAFWLLLIRKKLIRLPVSEEHSFLLTMGFVPFVFFTLTSIKGNIADPHWVNVAYFSFFPFLANYFVNALSNGRQRLIWSHYAGAYLLNAILVALILLQGYYRIIPIPPEKDATVNMLGWHETGDEIAMLLQNKGIEKPDFVVTREFQLGGAMSMFIPGQPFPFSLEKPERNQWSPKEKVLAGKTIAVCPFHECENFIPGVTEILGGHWRFVGDVRIDLSGREIRKLKIYSLINSPNILFRP